MKRYTKYPRTFHLEFSESVHSDDKIIKSLEHLEGKQVVVTLKMDGENTSIYSDGYIHARSIDSKSHWSRDIVKSIASVVRYNLPENYRICCENLTAKHSIYYPDGYLEGPLYLLSVWDEKNQCLSWEDTCLYAEEMDLPQPKVLYEGIFDIKKIKQIAESLDTTLEEGIVVRDAGSFKYEDFSTHVTKFVRLNHVQDNEEHWIKNAVPNGKFQENIKPSFLQTKRKLKV